jgi:hypothetical protein
MDGIWMVTRRLQDALAMVFRNIVRNLCSMGDINQNAGRNVVADQHRAARMHAFEIWTDITGCAAAA